MSSHVVQFDISVKFDMAELATWTPDRITALLAGIAGLISANRTAAVTSDETPAHTVAVDSRRAVARAVLDELVQRTADDQAEVEADEDLEERARRALAEGDARFQEELTLRQSAAQPTPAAPADDRPITRGPAQERVHRQLIERLKPGQSMPLSEVFRAPDDRQRAKVICGRDPQFSIDGGGGGFNPLIISRLGARPQSPAAEAAAMRAPPSTGPTLGGAKPSGPLTEPEKAAAREQLGALLREPGDFIHLDAHFGATGSRPYKAAHFVAKHTERWQVYIDLDGRTAVRWRLPIPETKKRSIRP